MGTNPPNPLYLIGKIGVCQHQQWQEGHQFEKLREDRKTKKTG